MLHMLLSSPVATQSCKHTPNGLLWTVHMTVPSRSTYSANPRYLAARTSRARLTSSLSFTQSSCALTARHVGQVSSPQASQPSASIRSQAHPHHHCWHLPLIAPRQSPPASRYRDAGGPAIRRQSKTNTIDSVFRPLGIYTQNTIRDHRRPPPHPGIGHPKRSSCFLLIFSSLQFVGPFAFPS